MAKWGELLSRDDWPWKVWKSLLLESGLIFLWLYFLFFTVWTIWPRKRILVDQYGQHIAKYFVTSLVITWLIADLTWGAVFGPTGGVVGYYLQSWLGESTFSDIGDWANRYLTLIGFIFSGGFG